MLWVSMTSKVGNWSCQSIGGDLLGYVLNTNRKVMELYCPISPTLLVFQPQEPYNAPGRLYGRI